MDLGPLDCSEVADQLTALRGQPTDPSLTAAIHRRSGGNPLFVESLNDSDGAGPVNLRGLLLERVARLPAPARDLLATAAGAGAHVSDQLLASVAGLCDDGLRDALRILVERGQLITDADGYAFRHDLIREAVYTDLLPIERRRLHRRFAEALRDSDDRTATERVPELARHWAAAGVAREALVAAWQAASIHRGRTAFGEELRQLEIVLDHWYAVPDAAALIDSDRLDVLEQAIAAAIAGGSTHRGLAHAEEALHALDPPNPERRAILLCQQARLLNRLDATGHQAIDEALSLVPPGRNDDVRRLVLAHSIGVGATEAHLGDLAERTAELTELAGRAGDPLGLAWS
ncbi:MAG: hypothetical protein ACREE7_19055, partial [Dongiaceae bacterium]